jgi:hypothetical protein
MQQLELWTIRFCKREDDVFKICLAEIQSIHVGTDDSKFLRLLGAHHAVNGSLNFFCRSIAPGRYRRQGIFRYHKFIVLYKPV